MSRSILVDGAEHAFPCGGTTQYNGEGSASACGLAALNFARMVFSMEQGGLHDVALLQAVMDRKCAEVRQLHTIPQPELILALKGSHFYIRVVVWQPSSRSRRYLPHPVV